jgi:hypothetical protein
MKPMRFLFEKRVRGFRVIELVALGFLAVLVFGVYFSKAGAGRESAKIKEVEKQIALERRQLRLLEAELAHLEQPERLEQLSTQYVGLAPIPAKREVTPEGLAEVTRQPANPGQKK